MTSWSYLTIVITLTPVLMMFAALGLLHTIRRRDKRRDPLTSALRALPGATLYKQLNIAWEQFYGQYLGIIVIAIGCSQIILLRHLSVDLNALNTMDYLLMGVVLFASFRFAFKTWHLPFRLRKLRDGLRAEIGSAQDIMDTLGGAPFFLHDVQGESFNIDHVVITSSGVFAVETKSRRKPPAGNGRPQAEFDGKRIRFPGWEETKPIEQADRQAAWLRKYLKKETGTDFPVTGVVSLPGWFVTFAAGASNSSVRVINPKAGKPVFLSPKPSVLTDQQMQQAFNTIGKIALAPELD